MRVRGIRYYDPSGPMLTFAAWCDKYKIKFRPDDSWMWINRYNAYVDTWRLVHNEPEQQRGTAL